MVALLTPDVSAMASMLVASMPRAENNSSAASRTRPCAWALRGRTIVRLWTLQALTKLVHSYIILMQGAKAGHSGGQRPGDVGLDLYARTSMTKPPGARK